MNVPPAWSAVVLQSQHAIGYAKFYSQSHDAVIRLYDEAGNVIETNEQAARQTTTPSRSQE